MKPSEELRKLRAEFNDDTKFTGGYRHRLEALVMFRRWTQITGDYRARWAAERFMEFIGKNDAS